MTFDVTVVGDPFLDLTFAGLPRLPGPGEEVLARDLHVAPGGTGMQAIGAARLGLSTALVGGFGPSGAGALVHAALAREGVAVMGGSDDSNAGVPVTALLATPSGVAMASVVAGREPRPEDVVGAPARATVASLGRLELVPESAATYAVTGGLELAHLDWADRLEAGRDRLAGARALVVNAAEATALTDADDPARAARRLARHVPTAVVTLGADGALAAEDDTLARAPAPLVEVVDATGAGDLFVAAYVWADLGGAPLQERLRWACLYAGLSVRAPTALAGALRRDALVREGDARGLRALPRE